MPPNFKSRIKHSGALVKRPKITSVLIHGKRSIVRFDGIFLQIPETKTTIKREEILSFKRTRLFGITLQTTHGLEITFPFAYRELWRWLDQDHVPATGVLSATFLFSLFFMFRLTGLSGWWIALLFGTIITGCSGLFVSLLRRPFESIYLILLPLLLALGVATIYFFAFLTSYVLFFALLFVAIYIVYLFLRKKFAFQKYFLGLAWGGLLFFFYIWLGLGFQIYKDFIAAGEGTISSELQEEGLTRTVSALPERWVTPSDWGIAPYRWYHYLSDRLNIVMQIAPLKPQYAIHFPERPRGGWIGISDKTPQELILGHAKYLKLQENFIWAKLIHVEKEPLDEAISKTGVTVVEYEFFDLTQNKPIFIYMAYLPRAVTDPADSENRQVRTWVFTISLESEVQIDYYLNRIIYGFSHF